MSRFWQIRTAFLWSNRQLVTLTWVVKISTTAWSLILLPSSGAITIEIWLPIRVLFVVCVLNVRKLSAFCPTLLRPGKSFINCSSHIFSLFAAFELIRSSTAFTSTTTSLVLVLKNCALICSATLWIRFRRLCTTPRWTRVRFTTSSWLEARLAFRRFKNCWVTSFPAKSWTSWSIRENWLLMVRDLLIEFSYSTS